MSSLKGVITDDGLYIIFEEIKNPQEVLTALSLDLKIMFNLQYIEGNEPWDILKRIPPQAYVFGLVQAIASVEVYVEYRKKCVCEQEFIDILIDCYSSFKQEYSKKFVTSCLDLLTKTSL